MHSRRRVQGHADRAGAGAARVRGVTTVRGRHADRADRVTAEAHRTASCGAERAAVARSSRDQSNHAARGGPD